VVPGCRQQGLIEASPDIREAAESPSESVDAGMAWGLVGRITAPRLPGGAPPRGEACAGGSPLDSWRVGPERGLADVVVEARLVSKHPSAAGRVVSHQKGETEVLELRIADCRFQPRVSVVPRNTVLRAGHDDPGLHTFHLYRGAADERERSLQNIAVPPGGPPVEWGLELSSRLHVRSDHLEWMEGWIVVTDHPAAITDEQGRFAMPHLDPGEWEVVLWHERLGEYRAFVSVPPDGPASLYTEFPLPP